MVVGLAIGEGESVKVKDEKIVLSASLKELLRNTLVTALEEAPSPVKELIRNSQPLKLEEKQKRTEKQTEQDSGIVF